MHQNASRGRVLPTANTIPGESSRTISEPILSDPSTTWSALQSPNERLGNKVGAVLHILDACRQLSVASPRQSNRKWEILPWPNQSHQFPGSRMEKRLLRWIGRTGLALVALAGLFACSGATYQIVGNWRDARHFPQRGKSVQAGPVKLNLDCSGQESPIVILDSGIGVPAIGWIAVQPGSPNLRAFARMTVQVTAGAMPGPNPAPACRLPKN
jgi:hypothetical protein